MRDRISARNIVRPHTATKVTTPQHSLHSKFTHTRLTKMVSEAERDEVAQEKYGKKFEECTPEERQSVGGTIGGRKRVEDIGPEGMSEMSKQQESVKAAHADEAPAEEDK